MPLFIMISGYLFFHLENDRGKYATFKDLFKNKFKLLIIPFYVFATVFMLTINDFFGKPYYSWRYQHLWFITMLFWCFIVTRVLSFLSFGKNVCFKAFILVLFFLLNLLPRLDISFWLFRIYCAGIFGFILDINCI